MLGSQPLSVLKDALICSEDLSDEILSKSGNAVSKRPRSGYFLIEKCFYNDLRDEESLDLSAPILSWLSTHSSLGSFTSSRMETTAFVDLDIRIGFPYLYVHSGSQSSLLFSFHFLMCD